MNKNKNVKEKEFRQNILEKSMHVYFLAFELYMILRLALFLFGKQTLLYNHSLLHYKLKLCTFQGIFILLVDLYDVNTNTLFCEL